MGKNHAGMVRQFGSTVEAVAGEKVASAVMEGSDSVSAASPREVAEWVASAVEKLDSTTSRKNRIEILEACGRNCSEHNPGVIARALARRKKFKSVDEFLASEVKKPQKGTRLVREGNELHHYYVPQAFTRPMRCFCGLLRDLPPDKTISETYCHCSKAFVKRYWESILEREVDVNIVKTAVTGSSECEFVVRL